MGRKLRRTALSYNDYGRKLTQQDPDSGVSTATYNAFDELTTSTDPRGQTRAYQYDELGRRVGVVDSAGTTQWIYDQGANGLGRLSETISPATPQSPAGQRVRYSYEPVSGERNRALLASVEYLLDGSSYQVGLAYDDLGRTERVSYPAIDGATPIVAKYTYDSSGLLSQLDDVGGAAVQPLWRVNETFEAHLLQRETFGNGASTVYAYNGARRWLEGIQTTLGASTVQSLEYTHYGNGQIATRTSPDLHREYIYDPLSRLSATLDTSASGTVSTPYAYDAIGNMVGRGATVVGFRAGQTAPCGQRGRYRIRLRRQR
jgi:YD repeat-containing protein